MAQLTYSSHSHNLLEEFSVCSHQLSVKSERRELEIEN